MQFKLEGSTAGKANSQYEGRRLRVSNRRDTALKHESETGIFLQRNGMEWNGMEWHIANFSSRVVKVVMKGKESKEDALVGRLGAVRALAEREAREELVLELHIGLAPHQPNQRIKHGVRVRDAIRIKSTDSASTGRTEAEQNMVLD